MDCLWVLLCDGEPIPHINDVLLMSVNSFTHFNSNIKRRVESHVICLGVYGQNQKQFFGFETESKKSKELLFENQYNHRLIDKYCFSRFSYIDRVSFSLIPNHRIYGSKNRLFVDSDHILISDDQYCGHFISILFVSVLQSFGI